MFDVRVVRSIPSMFGFTPAMLETSPWESGRQAARDLSERTDNPFDKETVPFMEWEKGFDHGVSEQQSAAMHVETLPERSFWATVNNMEIHNCWSRQETAQRLGISVSLLEEKMSFYEFYDEDGISLYEVATA